MPQDREIDVEDLMARVRENVARGRHGKPGGPMARTPGVGSPPVPAGQPLPSHGRIRQLNELLALDDREFVIRAFRKVLGRQPDPSGLDSYLRQLGRGWPKIAILARLRFSREGRSRNVRLGGLLLPFAVQLVYRIPILGYTLRLAVAVLRLPQTLREASQFELQAKAHLAELRTALAALESRQAQGLAVQAKELAGVRAGLEKLHAHTERMATPSNELTRSVE